MGEFRHAVTLGGLAKRILEEGQVPTASGIWRWLEVIWQTAAAVGEPACAAA